MWIETLKDLTLGILPQIMSCFLHACLKNLFTFGFHLWRRETVSANLAFVLWTLRNNLIYSWHVATREFPKGVAVEHSKKVFQLHIIFSPLMSLLLFVRVDTKLIFDQLHFTFADFFFLPAHHSALLVWWWLLLVCAGVPLVTFLLFLPYLCFLPPPRSPFASACCVLFCRWVSVCQRCFAPADLTCISVMSVKALCWHHRWDKLWATTPVICHKASCRNYILFSFVRNMTICCDIREKKTF